MLKIEMDYGELMRLPKIYIHRMWENISFFLIRISLSLQILWLGRLWLTIIISNYDSLCHSIEPKVNKELSLNLLESMLELFVKVRMFSFARDIKEKHKVKNKKTKARSLRTEIKKFSSNKVLITEFHQVFSVVSGLGL